ncbi:MAG: phosphatidate cytidylyltransferase [Planctomycetota bacterium]|jgi:phosphatidate cytidylyltransferase
MPVTAANLAICGILAVLTLVVILERAKRIRLPIDCYFRYVWAFFLVFGIAELVSLEVAVWILAVLCFLALREYMTLVDIRLQDRWGVVGAYLSIPFMIYYIQIDWYGMFIISIPVYAFLGIPFLVTLGGRETRGTIFSIGAIDFGLFLLVYCVGHIGYLARYSTWMAAFLVLAVALCDHVARIVPATSRGHRTRALIRYAIAAPLTVLLAWALSDWTGIPLDHSIILGLLIPVLVAIGRFTMGHIEIDLGIRRENLRPGSGQIIDCLKSFMYAAPVVFHYIRYFLT